MEHGSGVQCSLAGLMERSYVYIHTGMVGPVSFDQESENSTAEPHRRRARALERRDTL